MSAKVEIDSKILASKAIICDIEGTTTSISFVKDTLFPYAKENVAAYLKENFGDDEVKAVIAKLRKQAIEDVKSEVEGAVAIADDAAEETEQIATIVKSIEWQMSNDRKTGSLKTLQGLIYPKGYKDGTIKGHVYEDVPKALEQWVASGHKIYIYSSGSVDAQKLLFAHSEHGDLSAHIAGYFDTTVGAKQESKSYVGIAKEINFTPEEIVFLTDVPKEGEAAKEAGINVILLSRPGNVDLTDDEKAQYAIVESFADIPFETVGGVKRKIDEVTPDQQEE